MSLVKVTINDDVDVMITGCRLVDGVWTFRHNGLDIGIYKGDAGSLAYKPSGYYPCNSFKITHIKKIKDDEVDDVSERINNQYIKHIIHRYVQHTEYQRVLDYAIKSARIKSSDSPYSELLQIAKS